MKSANLREGVISFRWSMRKGEVVGSFLSLNFAWEEVRAIRNTSNAEMVMMCVQYSIEKLSSFMEDATIIPIK